MNIGLRQLAMYTVTSDTELITVSRIIWGGFIKIPLIRMEHSRLSAQMCLLPLFMCYINYKSAQCIKLRDTSVWIEGDSQYGYRPKIVSHVYCNFRYRVDHHIQNHLTKLTLNTIDPEGTVVLTLSLCNGHWRANCKTCA